MEITRSIAVMLRTVLMTLLLSQALPLAAEVLESGENSFTVSHSLETAAEAFVVYRTMTAHIDQWWNPAHSWSGEAANLYMKVERGGCFCERLPNGGFAEHLRIIYVVPGEELRFDGTLGPLQTMSVQGRMTWTIEKAEAGSRMTFTYRVFGHPPGGLTTLAPAVDGVIGEQLQRLGERLSRG
jgi:uncharacterized protein YndB with AHSA1/START domain